MICPACGIQNRFPWALVSRRDHVHCEHCAVKLKLHPVIDGLTKCLPLVLGIGLMLWFGSAMSIWLAIPLAIGVAMGSAMLAAAGGLAAGQLFAVGPGESLGAAYVSVLVSVSGLMLLLILITLLPEPFR